ISCIRLQTPYVSTRFWCRLGNCGIGFQTNAATFSTWGGKCVSGGKWRREPLGGKRCQEPFSPYVFDTRDFYFFALPKKTEGETWKRRRSRAMCSRSNRRLP